MGKDPDAIEQEIADTRARMGERMDALSYKTDVKARIGDKVGDTRDAVGGKVRELASGISDRAPASQHVRRQARQAVGSVRDNPLGLAIGAVAAGFLVGLLLPTSRAEDEAIGDSADSVKDQAMEAGQEALNRGRKVVEDVAQTARDSASRHASQLADTGGESEA
jgi:ElaB/YqjD/DUF883 family membrane-anchored ribosome-binding protein